MSITPKLTQIISLGCHEEDDDLLGLDEYGSVWIWVWPKPLYATKEGPVLFPGTPAERPQIARKVVAYTTGHWAPWESNSQRTLPSLPTQEECFKMLDEGWSFPPTE